MSDANLAKPRSFETKQHPGSYSPAPVPEFHQQARDPGYANSTGPDGDEPQEWPESDAAAGKFQSSDSGDTDAAPEKKAPAKTGGTSKAAATSK